ASPRECLPSPRLTSRKKSSTSCRGIRRRSEPKCRSKATSELSARSADQNRVAVLVTQGPISRKENEAMRCRRSAAMVVSVAGLLSIESAIARVVGAQVEPERPPVVTQHQITINGHALAYAAE